MSTFTRFLDIKTEKFIAKNALLKYGCTRQEVKHRLFLGQG